MGTDDDMSPGELRRTLARVERRLDDLITKDRYEAETKASTARIEALEESNKWRNRAIAGALIAASSSPLLTLLFQARSG